MRAIEAIRLTWHYIVAAIIAAGLLSFVIHRLEVDLEPQTVTILFGIKIGIVSVVTAAILFFYRLFYDDSTKMELKEYPTLVKYYKDSFTSLFMTNILIFASAGLDSYVVFFNDCITCQHVSHGCLLSGLLFLFAFVLSFYSQVFGELQTLRRAGRSERAITEDEKQSEAKPNSSR